MVKLRILEILEEQGHTKYWLYKRMDINSVIFSLLLPSKTYVFIFFAYTDIECYRLNSLRLYIFSSSS